MCYFKFGKISFYISDVVMKIFYQSNILARDSGILLFFMICLGKEFSRIIYTKKIMYEIKMNLM